MTAIAARNPEKNPLIAVAPAATEPASSESKPPLVRFVDVQKTYDGATLVVKNLNLSIRHGEFLTLLGPSGSGKTTTLMMLAGFEQPTHGEIFLDGAPIGRLPAAQARHRHGLPELRAVPAYERRAEPRVSAGGQARSEARRSATRVRARAADGRD